MYESVSGMLAAQDAHSKDMIDSLPQELQQPAVDIMASVNPAIEQVAKVAFRNGREAAYAEMRETVNSAVAQSHQWREKLRYIYDHGSDATIAEVGMLLLAFQNRNNN